MAAQLAGQDPPSVRHLAALLLAFSLWADAPFEHPYYKNKLKESAVAQHYDLVFLGDSLTDFHDWSTFGTHHNAGIAGDTTDGILYRLHYTLEKTPKTLVLMIGINDLLQGQDIDVIKRNYRKIFEKIETIDTVVVLSLLPVRMVPQTQLINENILRLNHFLKDECSKRGFVFGDLYSAMVNDKGGLKESFTSDGVHLTHPAYIVWEERLKGLLTGN